jgi:hypothetical protein
MAVGMTITIAPTLLRRMAERIGCSSMDVPFPWLECGGGRIV